jgi:hypothetical protein
VVPILRRRAKFVRSATREAARCRFRPTPYLVCRTHVPPDDHRPPDEALAQRAGALGRAHGRGVRDAGRGTGSGAGCAPGPHRPHTRTPAPPATRSSPAQTPAECGRPTRAGLRLAGPPSAGTGRLTTPPRRRPVWEDGRAGRAGAASAPQAQCTRAAFGRLERLGRPARRRAGSSPAAAWVRRPPPRGFVARRRGSVARRRGSVARRRADERQLRLGKEARSGAGRPRLSSLSAVRLQLDKRPPHERRPAGSPGSADPPRNPHLPYPAQLTSARFAGRTTRAVGVRRPRRTHHASSPGSSRMSPNTVVRGPASRSPDVTPPA